MLSSQSHGKTKPTEAALLSRIQKNLAEAQIAEADARTWKEKSRYLRQEFSRDSITASQAHACKEWMSHGFSIHDVSLTDDELGKIKDAKVRQKVKAIVNYYNERIDILKGNISEADEEHRRQIDDLTEMYESDIHTVKTQKDETVAKLKNDYAHLQEELSEKSKTICSLTESKAELQEELSEMSKTICLLSENEAELQKQLESAENDRVRFEGQLQEHDRQTEELAKELESLKAPKVPDLSMVIPQEIQEDRRMDGLVEQLTQRLCCQDVTTNIAMKPGKQICPSDGITLLMCVVSSNLNHSVMAAMKQAQIDGYPIRFVLILFHHLARHNCKISVPSRVRLRDRHLVGKALLVADAVYWSGNMYECETNTRLMMELKDLTQQDIGKSLR